MHPIIKLGNLFFNNMRNINISYIFLKYIRPIWYFHLTPPQKTNQVWIDYNFLSDNEKKIIHLNYAIFLKIILIYLESHT